MRTFCRSWWIGESREKKYSTPNFLFSSFVCFVVVPYKRIRQDEYHRGALKIDDKFGGSATDQYEAMFKVGAGVVGAVSAG